MSKLKSQGYRRIYGDDWRGEIQEIVSGFLFGIPLLYTMEVWFIGSYVRPPVLLTILVITFIVILSDFSR